MAILLLTGTPAQLQQALAIPGIQLDHGRPRDAGGGRFTISQFVGESVIPDLHDIGLTVEVEVTDAELAAHLASFRPPIA